MIALFLSLIAPANACSCLQPDLVRSTELNTDVLRVQVMQTVTTLQRRWYVVRVLEAYKGCSERGDVVVLRTAFDSAACGAMLTVGDRWIVTGSQAGWSVGQAPVVDFNSCDFSSRVKDIKKKQGEFLESRTVTCNGQFKRCADDGPEAACFVDPCQVTSCGVANAECRANYCGGDCVAEFYANDEAVCTPW